MIKVYMSCIKFDNLTDDSIGISVALTLHTNASYFFTTTKKKHGK